MKKYTRVYHVLLNGYIYKTYKYLTCAHTCVDKLWDSLDKGIPGECPDVHIVDSFGDLHF